MYGYLAILILVSAGVILTVAALAHALRSLKAVRANGQNGPRLIVARQGVRNEAIFLAVHCVLLAAIAWSQAVTPWDGRVMLTRNYFAAVASVLLSVATLAEYRDRQKLRRLFELYAL